MNAKAAPELPEGATWLNTDQPLSLEALRGHVVLLDFWTYCCINCMHVLPDLKALERRFEGEPFVVVGVHSAKFISEKDPDNIRRAIARYEVEHPVVVDSEHEIWREFGVKAWPTICLLDTAGQVAWQAGGEPDRQQLEVAIEQLIDRARRNGTLAEEPQQFRRVMEVTDSPLLFPGKLTVVPDGGAAALVGRPPGHGAIENGLLVVTDTNHNRVVVARLGTDEDGWPTAKLETLVGRGGVGAQDGAFNAASFNHPQGTALIDERLFIADTENHLLRLADLESETVSTIGGTGRRGMDVMSVPNDPLQMGMRSPWDVAAVPGAVFVAMAGAHQIWLYVERQNELHVYAGSGAESHVDGALFDAALAQPSGLSLGGQYLFFADSEISSVRTIDTSAKQVFTIMGQGLFDFGDVDGPLDDARLQHPMDVTFLDGYLYVADTYNNKIKVIDLDKRELRTVVGEGSGKTDVLYEPGGLDVLGKKLFIADTNNHRVRVLDPETDEIRTLDIEGLDAPEL